MWLLNSAVLECYETSADIYYFPVVFLLFQNTYTWKFPCEWFLNMVIINYAIMTLHFAEYFTTKQKIVCFLGNKDFKKSFSLMYMYCCKGHFISFFSV